MGHVLEVGEQLLGVLWQAVAAVAEGGVIIGAANPGVQAYAVDDVPGIEALGFGIGIQLVEIADPQGKIGIGKELYGLCLGKTHE